ncbi:hypothetical protein J6590_043146 [Homalodisca vitripennis]|nr:hypothetical protein J6590_043146 [Homalodisca vitripennis]
MNILLSPFVAAQLHDRFHLARYVLDGYHFHNFYSSSSNYRLEIALLRLQLQCLVPRLRRPGCESTYCEGKKVSIVSSVCVHQTKPVPASKRLLQVLTSTQERFVLVFRLLLTKPVSEKQLCSMDVDELTSQVFRRGAIWDKRLNKM